MRKIYKFFRNVDAFIQGYKSSHTRRQQCAWQTAMTFFSAFHKYTETYLPLDCGSCLLASYPQMLFFLHYQSFDLCPRVVHVGFVVDEVLLRRNFVGAAWFLLPLNILLACMLYPVYLRLQCQASAPHRNQTRHLFIDTFHIHAWALWACLSLRCFSCLNIWVLNLDLILFMWRCEK